MKVQVKDEQGIDEAGNKHPAPGIADGTHECELKDEYWSYNASCWCKTDYPIYYLGGGYRMRQIWVLAEQEKEGDGLSRAEVLSHPAYWFEGFQNELFSQFHSYQERENLSQREMAYKLGISKNLVSKILQGEANLDMKTLIEISLLIGVIPKFIWVPITQEISTDGLPYEGPSTRIAELEARVAELEGVLNNIGLETIAMGSHENKLIVIQRYATNALKNNTDGK